MKVILEENVLRSTDAIRVIGTDWAQEDDQIMMYSMIYDDIC